MLAAQRSPPLARPPPLGQARILRPTSIAPILDLDASHAEAMARVHEHHATEYGGLGDHSSFEVDYRVSCL